MRPYPCPLHRDDAGGPTCDALSPPCSRLPSERRVASPPSLRMPRTGSRRPWAASRTPSTCARSWCPGSTIRPSSGLGRVRRIRRPSRSCWRCWTRTTRRPGSGWRRSMEPAAAPAGCCATCSRAARSGRGWSASTSWTSAPSLPSASRPAMASCSRASSSPPGSAPRSLRATSRAPMRARSPCGAARMAATRA